MFKIGMGFLGAFMGHSSNIWMQVNCSGWCNIRLRLQQRIFPRKNILLNLDSIGTQIGKSSRHLFILPERKMCFVLPNQLPLYRLSSVPMTYIYVLQFDCDVYYVQESYTMSWDCCTQNARDQLRLRLALSWHCHCWART